jgi:acyl-coenzyme A synthetase/AMP-(fatty) acid ligase
VSIQRLVEQQAATRPDAIAVRDGTRRVSYYDLNQRANALARRLSRSGLQRGSHSVVRLPRGAELATVLLAVLKAGASYTWIDPGAENASVADAAAMTIGPRGSEERFRPVEVDSIFDGDVHTAPNLPILTRGSDIACVLADRDGRAAILVPHATVASLAESARAPIARWTGDAGALDLWAGLMTGAMVTVEPHASGSQAA